MSFIGIHWSSANFRACEISPEGRLLDEFSQPSGIAGLGREGMLAVMAQVAARWPDRGVVYASGMVGSNIGWLEAPYALAPASVNELSARSVHTRMGEVDVQIVPGICCQRSYDGGPDILRGEEIELFGLAALYPGLQGLVALPGTHTKWVCFEDGRITEFFTSMSGEIFDRLTAAGLLASIVDGEASDGPAFRAGVQAGGARQLGLSTLLFGARARVMRGMLARADAASYLRGMLIGSEIADALAIYPNLRSRPVPLAGNAKVCSLYGAALACLGVESWNVDSHAACLAGFTALDAAASTKALIDVLAA